MQQKLVLSSQIAKLINARNTTNSKPEFYGDLVYKFKKIVGKADFSDQFKKLSFVTNVLEIT